MNFFSFLIQKRVPSRTTIRSLTSAPLSWLGIGLLVLFGAIAITTYILLIQLNSRLLVTIPAHGGTLTEGVIGAPRVINPILARTETDVELSTLIYSGLVAKKADGSFEPVLADHYEVSPDNRMYTFTLRKKLVFHDKKPLTSADVAYTFTKVADVDVNPSQSDYWHDITISTPDESTISFILPEPRSDFLARTTTGILPAHLWQDIPDELFDSALQNSEPIGAGAFVFKSMQEQNGVPQEIVLASNHHFALGKPYLSELRIAFFANQTDLADALSSGTVDFSFALQPTTMTTLDTDKFTTQTISTNRTIGLFHLSGSPAADPQLISSINQFIDRAHILAIVENGYGIAPSILGATPDTETTLTSLKAIGYTQQDGILQKKGTPTGFSIAVENEPNLLAAARALEDELARVGILVSIAAFDPGTFADGLAAHEYTTILASDDSVPNTYISLLKLYTKGIPYIHDGRVHIPSPAAAPTLRYSDARNWYAKTDNVWKWFAKQ